MQAPLVFSVPIRVRAPPLAIFDPFDGKKWKARLLFGEEIGRAHV